MSSCTIAALRISSPRVFAPSNMSRRACAASPRVDLFAWWVSRPSPLASVAKQAS